MHPKGVRKATHDSLLSLESLAEAPGGGADTWAKPPHCSERRLGRYCRLGSWCNLTASRPSSNGKTKDLCRSAPNSTLQAKARRSKRPEPIWWKHYLCSSRPRTHLKLRVASAARSLSRKLRFLLGRLRVLSGDEVCRILEQNGFVAVRQRGSHRIMQEPHRRNDYHRPCSPPQSTQARHALKRHQAVWDAARTLRNARVTGAAAVSPARRFCWRWTLICPPNTPQ
jgi:hypothetical protein